MDVKKWRLCLVKTKLAKDSPCGSGRDSSHVWAGRMYRSINLDTPSLLDFTCDYGYYIFSSNHGVPLAPGKSQWLCGRNSPLNTDCVVQARILLCLWSALGFCLYSCLGCFCPGSLCLCQCFCLCSLWFRLCMYFGGLHLCLSRLRLNYSFPLNAVNFNFYCFNAAVMS